MTAPARATTLDDTRAKGLLTCGVVVEQEDFNKIDSHGDLSGFSSAVCRAVAAAVLGDAGKLQLQGFPDDAHGIAALGDKRIALLVGTTPQATSAMLHHVRFSPVLFVDGQSFLVRRDLDVRRAADLRDRLICYLSETPAEAGLDEWLGRAHLAVRHHPFEEGGEMNAALVSGNCDAITADISALAAIRADFHNRKSDFVILPRLMNYDPFAAATRNDDPAWTTIVSDVVTVLIEAEQFGITRDNLASARKSPDPAKRRLLGPTPGIAKSLGLSDGWAARALAPSGNYGEILAAATGPGTAMDLPRGANALWDAGGLIAAPSIP